MSLPSSVVSLSITLDALWIFGGNPALIIGGVADLVWGTVKVVTIDLSPHLVFVARSSTPTLGHVTVPLTVSHWNLYGEPVLVVLLYGLQQSVDTATFTVSDVFMTLTDVYGRTVNIVPTLGGFVQQNNNPGEDGGRGGAAVSSDPTQNGAAIGRGPFPLLTSLVTANYAYLEGFAASIPPWFAITQPDWLIINEPVLSYTDRTQYLFKGAGFQHTFTLQLRQRGQAQVQLQIAANDSYAPTRGTQFYLYDQTATYKSPAVSVWQLAFSGLIQDIENQWIGRNGDRFVNVTAVSLESIFDTIYATPVQYVNQTCGAIVADLFSRFETGSPVQLGTISAGPIVPLLVTNYEKLSDLFDQLATTAEFVWFVNPANQQLNFQSPSTNPAPFILNSNNILWDTVNWKASGADYRNRQAVRLSYDAFGHSCEFFVGAGQRTITLARPVQQVTNAWATLSTCNTATGTFAGQPNPGDTVSIQVPTGTWLAAHIYAINGILIDANGFAQKVTTAGTSAGSGPPAFSDITTGTTIDGTVIWTCIGPAGLATGDAVYTFVNPAPTGPWNASTAYGVGNIVSGGGNFAQSCSVAGTSGTTEPVFSTTTGGTTSGDGGVTWTCIGSCLDNTQYGQVVIGASAAATCQNLMDAINARVTDGGSPVIQLRGFSYSLPTWENALCNAINISGSSFTLQQKHAGTGWLSTLSSQAGVVLPAWIALHAYSLGSEVLSGANVIQKITTAGTSGSSLPPFSSTAGATTADGTAVWTCQVTAFAWSSTTTSGGTSPQGSLGPGEGATISLQVYVQGTSVAAPGVAYTPGSAIVTLATPLNVGSNLNIEYTRADGNVIEVENTALVTALAATSHGTGKYQQIVDVSSQGLISTSNVAGLQLAQQALAAFSVIPQTFSFVCYDPGLYPGQTLTSELVFPTGSTALLGSVAQPIQWIIEEISAELVPVDWNVAAPYLPGFGHYRYTVRCVNIQEIGSYLDFWNGLGGGGSGSGSGAAGGLVATSGGGLQPSPSGGTVPAWYAEVPGGLLNGSTTAFSLTYTPATGSLTLFLNIVQREGTDFTITGSTITFTTAPKATDTNWFYARYQH